MKKGARLVLGKDDDGRRLDRVLRIALGNLPLSAIHRALRKGDIRVGGERRDPESRCRAGEVVEISGVVLGPGQDLPSPPPVAPAPALPILLETPDLLFLNKPMGVLVHDGPDSLEAQVRAYLAPSLQRSLSFAPGPLHRLDRNTSGVIAFSRSIDGARDFTRALRERRLAKTYLAILEGPIGAGVAWRDLLVRDGDARDSRVAAPQSTPGRPALGAKEALTEVTPLAVSEGYTLAAVALGTGRTHQIRAQAAAHGHPLAGDRKYGGHPCELPYYLHAWRLSSPGGVLAGLPPAVEAPIPYYFIEKVRELFPTGKIEVYLGLEKR
ncbi:RluA family pseudouridine synthase [bacterium]|nr:RluA family pseudouridine synthase [bacterium]